MLKLCHSVIIKMSAFHRYFHFIFTIPLHTIKKWVIQSCFADSQTI
jgi:hypothetical protein